MSYMNQLLCLLTNLGTLGGTLCCSNGIAVILLADSVSRSLVETIVKIITSWYSGNAKNGPSRPDVIPIATRSLRFPLVRRPRHGSKSRSKAFRSSPKRRHVGAFRSRREKPSSDRRDNRDGADKYLERPPLPDPFGSRGSESRASGRDISKKCRSFGGCERCEVETIIDVYDVLRAGSVRSLAGGRPAVLIYRTIYSARNVVRERERREKKGSFSRRATRSIRTVVIAQSARTLPSARRLPLAAPDCTRVPGSGRSLRKHRESVGSGSSAGGVRYKLHGRSCSWGVRISFCIRVRGRKCIQGALCSNTFREIFPTYLSEHFARRSSVLFSRIFSFSPTSTINFETTNNSMLKGND